MWRRAWRDKILPALANFRPDFIVVSAGFDAHKKEDLNLRSVGWVGGRISSGGMPALLAFWGGGGCIAGGRSCVAGGLGNGQKTGNLGPEPMLACPSCGHGTRTSTWLGPAMSG